MEIVKYGKNTPGTFLENPICNADSPYIIRVKTFIERDICPLHYSENTLEILLCDSLTGEVILEKKKFTLEGKQVFIIPAKCIHTVTIEPCEGLMFLVHLSYEELGKIINLEYFCNQVGLKINSSYFCLQSKELYDKLVKHINMIVENQSNFALRIYALVSFFVTLSAYLPNDETMVSSNNTDVQMKKIIDWTLTNYQGKITSEMAAHYLGFNKTYFCTWFKKNSGMAYLKYLNAVRVEQSCGQMSRSNKTITEIAQDCGYCDESHFIHVFKSIKGMTPADYRKRQKTVCSILNCIGEK